MRGGHQGGPPPAPTYDTMPPSQQRQEEEEEAVVGRLRMGAWVTASLTAGLMLFAALAYNHTLDAHKPTTPSSTTSIRGRISSSHSGVMELREGLCQDDPDFVHHTLKLVHEETMFSLFGNQEMNAWEYEASDIEAKGDYYYIVCDSSWSIFRVRKDLLPWSEANTEIFHDHSHDNRSSSSGDVDHGDLWPDSEYEGIFYDDVTGVFYVVREALPSPSSSSYRAVIEEVRLSGDGEEEALPHQGGTGRAKVQSTILTACETEEAFTADLKGLEGLSGLYGEDGVLYLLGLCEGNGCLQGHEDEYGPGDGVILVMKKEVDEEAGSCVWRTHRRMAIPQSAHFRDYSAMDYNPHTNLFAITSQEDSQLWVGALINPNGPGPQHFDPDKSYLEEQGKVYDFPRDHDCFPVYCNIEGVQWISETMVVTVSDAMKDRGREDFRCRDKDQSVHVFLVPQ